MVDTHEDVAKEMTRAKRNGGQREEYSASGGIAGETDREQEETERKRGVEAGGVNETFSESWCLNWYLVGSL